MLGAGLGFAMMVAFVKAAATSVPVPQIVCIRSAVTALTVSLLMLFQGIPFRGQNTPLLFLRALLGSIAIGLAFYSTSVIPLVDMSVIIKTSVLFTAVFAALWLQERPTRNLLLYSLLGFIGIALIIKPTGNVLALGGLAALGAAVVIGLIGVVIRKLQQTEHSYMIVFVYTATATVGYGLFFGSSFTKLDHAELLYVLGAGVVGTIAQLLFTLAYKYGAASEVSPFLYSETLFAALFGALYFQEFPDLLNVLGAMLTIISGIAIARGSREKKALESA